MEDSSLPLKMFFPVIPTRMEQLNHFSRILVYTSNVRSFVVVACKTCKRKIAELVSSVMFTGDNMVDLKSKDVVLLRYPAVFAPGTCSLPHLVEKSLLHPSGACVALF